MKNKEFLMHLLATVSNFVLERDPRRMVISLHHEADGIHLCIVDDCVRSDEELATIAAALRPGAARPELADYYGTMGGSDLLGKARLDLIGWQVKCGDVSRTGNGTKIDLWLGSDRFDSSHFTIPDSPKK
jgi:hypothetical protein